MLIGNTRYRGCLNRTFYGIETMSNGTHGTLRTRLNRTFYGIETFDRTFNRSRYSSLNRTFYGIETLLLSLPSFVSSVLIVPFMELKLINGVLWIIVYMS